MPLPKWIFIGILCFIYAAILISALKAKKYSFRTIFVKDDKNIEPKIRILMKENPDSEIVVINNSKRQETTEILKKMEYDFPELHIVTCKK